MDNDVKLKIDSVDEYIDKLARKLTDNNGLREKLKGEIKEIVLQNDLRSDESSSILRILSEENSEADPELIIKAKEASLELSRWGEENIDSVRLYRGEDLTNSLVKETIKDNPGITEAEVETVRSLGKNVNEIYNSDGGIENQKSLVKNTDTPGKANNAWNDTQGINGLLKQKPEQLKEIIDNHEKITTELQNQNIKLPYQKSSKLASYDRVMNSIKNPEMRRYLESARSRFQTLERLTNGRFSQISNNFINRIGSDRLRSVANNFFNKSIVNIGNGFASKIGNQAARDFVQKTMGSIMQNGLSQGMKSAVNGLMKKGVQAAGKAAMNMAAKVGLKSAAMALKTALGAALGAATAGIGTVVMAALEGLKMVGKFFGNLFKGLGLELTNSNLANTVIGVMLIIFVLLFGMGTALADDASSLVPRIEIDEGLGEYTNDMSSVPIPGTLIPCGQDMSQYEEELKNKVNSAGFRTREAVATAAKYLSSEFEYNVPYFFSGGHSWRPEFDNDGGISADWGCDRTVPGSTSHYGGTKRPYGLDCSGFVTWCYLTAGFKDYGGSAEYRWNSGNFERVSFNSSTCSSVIEKLQPGDVLVNSGEGISYHTSIVLWTENNRVKYAHSTSGGVQVDFFGCSDIKFNQAVYMQNYFDKFSD